MIEPNFAEIFYFTRYLFAPKIWYPGAWAAKLYVAGARVRFQGRTGTIMERRGRWAQLQFDISPSPAPLGFMTYTDVDLATALDLRDIHLLEDEEYGYESTELVSRAGSTGRVRFDADPTDSQSARARGVSFGQSW